MARIRRVLGHRSVVTFERMREILMNSEVRVLREEKETRRRDRGFVLEVESERGKKREREREHGVGRKGRRKRKLVIGQKKGREEKGKMSSSCIKRRCPVLRCKC